MRRWQFDFVDDFSEPKKSLAVIFPNLKSQLAIWIEGNNLQWTDFDYNAGTIHARVNIAPVVQRDSGWDDILGHVELIDDPIVGCQLGKHWIK